MLNKLIPILQKYQTRCPNLYLRITGLAKRFLGKRLGVYPRILGNESKAVLTVLKSSQWNMAHGRGLVHERLEEDFSAFVGVNHSIAVGCGGIALQMSMRALGLRPGDEVIHQVDTCSATAMSVMNAGATPIFSDINPKTFMLDLDSVSKYETKATRALIATHMWGNPEDMKTLRAKADKSGWKLIEDGCLALGGFAQGRSVGGWGDVGVFSFGCAKPIQGGEGGMIVTADEGLARELRSMRHWGDRTIDFGVRDVEQLSWNGRMSEIIAAVVREQLRGYPNHLSSLREAVQDFASFVSGFPGLSIMLGNADSVKECVFSQIVLRIDKEAGISKKELWDGLAARGIPVWHGNFELINSLSFFGKDRWREWILRGDVDSIQKNYCDTFPNALSVYNNSGLSFAKFNFLSSGNLRHLKTSLVKVLATAHQK